MASNPQEERAGFLRAAFELIDSYGARSLPVHTRTLLELRIAELLEKEAELDTCMRVQRVHLDALRIISAALGHPFKDSTGHTCIDLANLAAAKLTTQEELMRLAHSIAYESATAIIDGCSQLVRGGDWIDTSIWSDELRKNLEGEVRYLDLRGLIERDPAHPHHISFRNESEATNG